MDTLGKLRAKERNIARSILAAIVLIQNPLRMSDLVELLSQASLASDVSVDKIHQWIEKVVDELGSIISVDDNQLIRIPHKSFSDFLLDHVRSLAAMRCVLPEPEDQELCSDSFVLDCEEENASLALACLQLAGRHNLSLDFHSIMGFLKRSDCSLHYAHKYWFIHLRDAGGKKIPNLDSLADAMKLTYEYLQPYAAEDDETVALATILSDTTKSASKCVDQNRKVSYSAHLHEMVD